MEKQISELSEKEKSVLLKASQQKILEFLFSRIESNSEKKFKRDGGWLKDIYDEGNRYRVVSARYIVEREPSIGDTESYDIEVLF